MTLRHHNFKKFIFDTIQQANKCAKVEAKALFEHHLLVQSLVLISLTTFMLQPMLPICER
jgi:hypothetical protein